MSTINIPSVHLPGIKILTELSEDKIQLIYEFLKNIPAPLGVNRFISSFSEALGGEEFEPVADAIYSFGQLLSYKDYDEKLIADDLTESYQELASIELPDYEKGILNERLFRILSNSGFLVVTTQAYNIGYEISALTKSTITSDIRLLFGHNDYKTKNALLLYKMILKFRSKGQTESQTFYLDRNDLLDLKSEIEESLLNDEKIRNENKGVLNFIELS